jgi:glycine cleavage system aminomethyltransferase T
MSETTLPPELAAIRTATALARSLGTRMVRLRGEGAREAALWLLPSRLHLRDAQARQSLLLDASGRPIADVVVCADDEDYLLLLDGPGDPVAHVREHARGDVAVEDLADDHALLEVHGPWAWELVAEVLGADLVALPYLNFFRIDEGYCVRAGRTGEFGYQLVVRRDEADRVATRIVERGAELDLAEVGADALSLCGFENWFFDAHHVPPGATPIELQLQWRLATDRDFLGREAIEARRASATTLQVCLLASDAVAAGDRVSLDGRDVGKVTRAERSHVRGEWIVSALVEARLAHGGIDRFAIGSARARSVAPPLVDNQSLYVDPRRHAYRTRDEVRFRPLVRA